MLPCSLSFVFWIVISFCNVYIKYRVRGTLMYLNSINHDDALILECL